MLEPYKGDESPKWPGSRRNSQDSMQNYTTQTTASYSQKVLIDEKTQLQLSKKNIENQIREIKAVGKIEGPLHVQTERKLQMLKRDALSSEL